MEPVIFARQVGAAIVLVTGTLLIHCIGVAALIHLARARIDRGIKGLSPWRSSLLMVRFTTAMIVLHILEIFLWTSFYRWFCFPSWETCVYFSAASYSTVGYGDVLLPHVWRLLGPVEGIAGVLMTGLSVSLLFAIATRLVESETVSKDSPDASGSIPVAALIAGSR
ncbi:MAG TPA: potassium channel family protein [Candidatus Sulfotelmatobacter sp.]|nr:potassium channel family protein [Candidatus Sulfotelmatobacter sp.]HKN71621.1 potassium channel family protein [Terriglobales bacterium]